MVGGPKMKELGDFLQFPIHLFLEDKRSRRSLKPLVRKLPKKALHFREGLKCQNRQK